MKILTALLFVLFGVNNWAFAQLAITAFPFASQSTNVKNISLGNATVSLGEEFGVEPLNPAGIGNKGIFRLSPDFSKYRQPLRLGWDQYKLYADYGFKKSSIAFSITHLETEDQITLVGFSEDQIYKINNREIFAKAGYAYSFDSGVNIGTAFNYLYTGEASGTTISAQFTKPVSTYSVDVGLQHEFSEIQLNQILIQPNIGIVLNNFGSPVTYSGFNSNDPLPTKLQIGAGLNLKSTRKVYNQTLVEIQILQNASKIMARNEQKSSENGIYFGAMNPFKALFNSWGEYRYFNGQKIENINTLNQIWWHTGLELKLLESLSLRLGHQKASESEKSFTFNSIGLGLDLFYVVFDYSYVHSQYRNYLPGHHWQLTGRIPLDGNKPDTIFEKLLKKHFSLK